MLESVKGFTPYVQLMSDPELKVIVGDISKALKGSCVSKVLAGKTLSHLQCMDVIKKADTKYKDTLLRSMDAIEQSVKFYGLSLTDLGAYVQKTFKLLRQTALSATETEGEKEKPSKRNKQLQDDDDDDDEDGYDNETGDAHKKKKKQKKRKHDKHKKN